MNDQSDPHPPTSQEELQHRFAGLNRLLQATRALAAEIDPEKTLRRIVLAAQEALDCERASLFQYDPKTNELYTTVVSELEIGEIRKGLEAGITGYVARTGKIANVPDPTQDARWNSAVDRATGFHTRSILAAPIRSPRDGGLLGVLQLLNRRDGPFTDADEELIEAFGQHVAVALDRTRLVEELKRREQLEASLKVARAIQRGFMPEILPEVPGYEIATWWHPNEAVGGDYCDVIPLADGRVGLCIADVSGHGLGPSLIMASVRAALRALLLHRRAADDLLRDLARSLATDLRTGIFITKILAILDPHTHEVEFANAGHGPALHYSAADGRFITLEATGLPLGVSEEELYPRGPDLQLAPGDMLVLCTDGVVEAMDLEDRPFGQPRLEEMVHRLSNAPISDLVEQIGAAVERHFAAETPPDDLTVLIARRQK